jgi:acyl-[acyl-carrier-protein]-phospholipid O-acyltransferase/long-chain-fatty-acid--[acyl-carrier-protein] ligase
MGVPDPGKGEALVLLTIGEISPTELRDKLLATGVPNLWVPRLIRLVDAIPVLGTGKIDLKGCKELALKMVAK